MPRPHCADSGNARDSPAFPLTGLAAGYARLTQVRYAGDITPEQAWKLLRENPEAVLVDVRTDAEWRFVGVPDLASLGRDVVYIGWNAGDGRRNDDFGAHLLAQVPGGDDRPVNLRGRSGNRAVG